MEGSILDYLKVYRGTTRSLPDSMHMPHFVCTRLRSQVRRKLKKTAQKSKTNIHTPARPQDFRSSFFLPQSVDL